MTSIESYPTRAPERSNPPDDGLVYRILGPLEVRVEGRRVVLGSAKERALLIRLLLSANRVVPLETLIEDLWGAGATDQAAGNLRVYVSRLRKRLREASGEDVLASRPPGYVLNVDPATVDAARCEAMAAQVRRSLAAGLFEAAAAEARAALALWRGPALGDAAGYLFAEPEAARLEELQRVVLEDRIEADLALGRSAELVGELNFQVGHSPYRERLWRQLMLALYRSGRQVEALRAYEQLRTRLAEDLGIRPSTELSSLESDILLQSPGLDHPAPPVAHTGPGAVVVCRSGPGSGGPDRAVPILKKAAAEHGGVVSVGPHEAVARFATPVDAIRCSAEVVRVARRSQTAVRVGAHGTGGQSELDALQAVADDLSCRAAAGEALLSDELAGIAGQTGFRTVPSAGGAPTRHRLVVDPGHHTPVAAARPSRPFFGRRRELDTLLENWERACAGGIQLSVVAGEAGIGKTSLVQELAARCWSDGGVVLFGHCDETMVVPYQPFSTAAGQYLDQRDPQDVSAWGLPGAAELASLVGRPLSDLSSEPAADALTRRFWLFDAFTSVFREASEEAPVLLVLDDLHWGDVPTLRLLRHLVEQGPELAIHVVVTYRPDQAGPTSSMAAALGELARITPYSRLRLTGLGADEITAVLASRWGVRPSEDVVAQILRESEGNPFFVEELVLQAEQGAGPGGDPSSALDESGLTARAVPERINTVIRRRTDRLPEPIRTVVELAAVLGRTFRIEMLDALSGLGDDQLSEALDGAVQAGLIEEDDTTFGVFRFGHVLIRHSLHDGIGPTRRAALHRRAGLLLLDRYGLDSGPFLRDIARHLFAGVTSPEDARVAFDALMASGRDGAQRLAHEDAVTNYRLALGLLRAGHWGDAELEVIVLLKLADAEGRAGQIEAAAALTTEATAMARRSGSSALLARVALGRPAESGLHGWMGGQTAHLSILTEALGHLGANDLALRCRLLQQLAIALHRSGNRDEAPAIAREAIAIASTLGDPELVVGAKEAELVSLLGPELDPTDQRRRADEIVDAARACGNSLLIQRGHQLRLAALLQGGDLDAYRRGIQEASTMGSERSVPALAYWTTVQEAMVHLAAGDLRRSELRATEAFIAGYRIDEATASAILGPQLLAIGWLRGRTDGLVDPAERLAARFPELAVHQAALALVHAETQAERAHPIFESMAADGFAGIPRDDHWVVTMFLLCLVCARLRDRRRAGELLELVRPFAHRIAAPSSGALFFGSMALGAGVVAREAGRDDDARLLLEHAEAENRRMGAQPFVALALMERARGLADPQSADMRVQAAALIDSLELGGVR